MGGVGQVPGQGDGGRGTEQGDEVKKGGEGVQTQGEVKADDVSVDQPALAAEEEQEEEEEDSGGEELAQGVTIRKRRKNKAELGRWAAPKRPRKSKAEKAAAGVDAGDTPQGAKVASEVGCTP